MTVKYKHPETICQKHTSSLQGPCRSLFYYRALNRQTLSDRKLPPCAVLLHSRDIHIVKLRNILTICYLANKYLETLILWWSLCSVNSWWKTISMHRKEPAVMGYILVRWKTNILFGSWLLFFHFCHTFTLLYCSDFQYSMLVRKWNKTESPTALCKHGKSLIKISWLFPLNPWTTDITSKD